MDRAGHDRIRHANEAKRGSTHIHEMLRSASSDPDATLLVFDGEGFSVQDVRRLSESVARGLVDHGLQTGDRVVIMLPGRPEAVWSWFGTTWAGGIDAPVPPDVKGAMLEYYLADLEPRFVIADAEGLQKIALTSYTPELAVVVGDWDGRQILSGTHHTRFDVFAKHHTEPELPVPSAEGVGTIIYTSGTTGPSKGAMLSRGYWLETSLNHMLDVQYEPGWKVYGAQPLCHMDARSVVIDCLLSRATMILASRFSASSFWADVESFDADVFVFIGTMIHLINKQPDRQTGKPKRPRLAWGSATPAAIYDDFEKRFGVTLIEGYGMTEVPYIASQTIDTASPGNVGHVVGALQAKLVDDSGRAVEPGQAGELVVRPTRPHAMMQGYWRKPEATLSAIRDLWFHTGDLMRSRDDGMLEYVGRKKDSIRRRGENVSAWEVEQAALRHPEVKEAAAFGVPAEVGDEDVALLVVPMAPDQSVNLAALRTFMAADLPRYALPRFLELVDGLPKTPSERVAKGLVQERGLTSAAYDAEHTSD